MRTVLNAAIAGMVMLGGLWITTGTSYAKPEFAKKETKACNFCHANLKDMKELNDAGKYYKSHGYSLEGYSEKK